MKEVILKVSHSSVAARELRLKDETGSVDLVKFAGESTLARLQGRKEAYFKACVNELGGVALFSEVQGCSW